MTDTTMTKALFFDIDGTLVSFKTHRIPDSTVEALRQAKAHGTRVYISTGRPVGFINNLGQIADLIDGYITTTGALCIVGEERFGLHSIEPHDADTIMAACREMGKSCVVVGQEHISIINDSAELTRQFREGLNLRFDFAPLATTLHEPLLQLSPFFTSEEEKEVMSLLSSSASSRWHPAFTDITHRDADKGKALLAMCQHEGIAPGDTMAFGDGGNDIPIIRQAAIGVAMGNANDEVKGTADYVTTTVDDDGVLHALRHFHII